MHPTREKILACLRVNPNATFEEMMEASGVKSKAVVDYHITKLVMLGFIKRMNRYQVVKKPNKESGRGKAGV